MKRLLTLLFVTPVKTVSQIIYHTVRRHIADKNSLRAVTLTYYTMFAIVPIAALLFGIAKGFSLDEQLNTMLAEKFAHQREQFDYIRDFAGKTLAEASGGVVAGVGFIALFWTVFWLIINFEQAFNDIWELPSRRNIWHKFSTYLALILLTPVLLVVTGAADVMVNRQLMKLCGKMGCLDPAYGCFLEFVSFAAPAVITGIVFALIFRFAPNTKVKLRYALLAGLVTGIGFILLQNGFVLLQKTVFNYNRIYGSFAALPLFLIWMNWSWILVLLGAELCYVCQHFDHGVFDSRRINAMSDKLRREHQLVILKHVFDRFNAAGGATETAELRSTLKLPAVLLQNEIDELIACKLLCRTISAANKPALLPGVQPEKFTVADFFKAVYGEGDSQSEAFFRCDELITALERDIAGATGSRLVKNIF